MSWGPPEFKSRLINISDLRGDAVVETKATLKVVGARVKCVLRYSSIKNATLCSLPWTQAVNFISKRTIVCSYVPATA